MTMIYALGAGIGALFILAVWLMAVRLEAVHYNRRNSPHRH